MSPRKRKRPEASPDAEHMGGERAKEMKLVKDHDMIQTVNEQEVWDALREEHFEGMWSMQIPVHSLFPIEALQSSNRCPSRFTDSSP